MKRRRDPAARALRVKVLLLALALGLAVASHLRPVYRFTVQGEPLPGRYSLAQAQAGEEQAREIAEEILGTADGLADSKRRFYLSLHPADGDPAALTEALLRGTEGIQTAAEVRVNGIRLGNVEDGEALQRALQRSIRGQMPMKAVSGSISGRLELRPVYTRVGSCTPNSDMVLLITGVAPVVYLDPEGKLA